MFPSIRLAEKANPISWGMSITRRHILAVAGGGVLSRLFGATVPGVTNGLNQKAEFALDRLLNVTDSLADDERRSSAPQVRKYVASAHITLFSIPLVSKSSVGSGYAVVEQAGHTLAIQFGAGSYPENARGLNRLGFIQEGVIEERPGMPAECAWLAFMTTSKENNLDQAKKALEASGSTVPYSASQGYGRTGSFTSRLDRLEFPSRYTWRDINPLVEKARAAMGAGDGAEADGASEEQAGTFLYMVRQATLDARPRTTSALVFNNKQFRMDARKEFDASSTAYFASRNVISAAGKVTRLEAVLTNKVSGEKTPFRLWFEAGAGPALPLRFEYQAKSFLRLTFEADVKAVTPPIQYAFREPKEAA
jgi:hypothetical protein